TRQTSEELLAQTGTGPRIEAAILRLEGRLGDLLLIAQLMEGFKPVEPAQALARCGIAFDRLSALFARATGEVITSG
ncbi:hypothetical protein, partial [Variovorax sp. PvP013]|uniref:hypothetical protein n=1 Tax=Variovorax sp. PvP013 TaxID=3156435 RepID=UPI003D248DD3